MNRTITRSWNRYIGGFEQSKISFKLKNSRVALIAWLQGGKENSKKKIQGIKNRIDDLKNNTRNFDLTKLRLLRKELGEAYKDEEAY